LGDTSDIDTRRGRKVNVNQRRFQGMGAVTTQSETRLATLLDEREITVQKWESLMSSVNARESQELTEVEGEHVKMYRERVEQIDAETTTLADDIERTVEAVKNASRLRRMMAGGDGSVEEGADGEIVYRTYASYARDEILTRGSTMPECAKIANAAGGEDAVLRARERLQQLKSRTPANTLSSNVAGLQNPQHIDQIFQVIDASRPIVASATRADLERGQLTYPKVVTRPVVAVQATEKTEAGNQGMEVDMVTANASVYLGGGDLSWQAVNWSSPSALELWFKLAGADYALKTERDAAAVLRDSGFGHIISAPLAGTPDFATLMTAVGAGGAAVFANSGRMADTVYMAVDRYWYMFGLTSTPQTIFTVVDGNRIGPLTFVPSRGLDAGLIIVGDSDALLVAETPGAPVDLQVVEPAIGGLEVGIIGGFEAVVVDDGAFANITTAS
jgi:hypothetical protein